MNCASTISKWAVLTISAAFAPAAVAQTCASPLSWHPGSTGAATGTTCAGDTTAAGYCGGNLDAPGPAYVMQATFAPNRTFSTISLQGGSGYDAVIYVSAAAEGCGTNAACIATGDSGAPILSGNIPDGDYYIIVTAATFDNPGSCGTFTLSSDGSLPLVLTGFTVS